MFLQVAGWGSEGEGGKGDRVNPIPGKGSNPSDPSQSRVDGFWRIWGIWEDMAGYVGDLGTNEVIRKIF